MASLLGNLIFAGLQTLLTTQSAVGGTTTMYSINTGALQSLDVSLFVPSLNAAAGIGATMQPLLLTRAGAVVVYLNPNTTAIPGELLAAYFHSRIR